jgi:hypothetical protein
MQHHQLKEEEEVATIFVPEEFEENKQPPALRGAFEAVKVDASSKRFWNGPSMNGNEMFCYETSGCTCDGGELFDYSLLGDSLF